VSEPAGQGGRGALTPAVVAAAAFATLAALASVAFVTARGGLALPVAATETPPVFAAASPPLPAEQTPAATPSEAPIGSSIAPTPSTEATPEPSAPAEASPSPPGPPIPAASLDPRDPLAALPPCPSHPGCYLYTVRRGDTYSGVSDRFGVGIWIMTALNPEVGNRQIVLVGQTLYLGHDPTARLDLCPDGTCHLYVVRAGDTLSAIAGRYGLSVAGIEASNPSLEPSRIVSGEVIRLPLYRAA